MTTYAPDEPIDFTEAERLTERINNPGDDPFAMLTGREDFRAALDDVLDAYESGRAIPAGRVRAYRTILGRPAVVDDPGTPEARRDDGIARATAKWTDEEVAQVDAAIRAVTRRCRLNRMLEQTFTTADVWRVLGPGFPVTKGIAGRMIAAKSAGLIANTGRTIIAPPDAPGPNHGQRLTVWRAL